MHDLVPLLDKFRVPRHAYRTIAFLLFDHIGGVNTLFYTLSNAGCVITVGDRSPDPELASVERDVLELVNASGVGPMGLGGRTTALACAVEAAPCHIASLPVAVCLGCHSHRVRSVEL